MDVLDNLQTYRSLNRYRHIQKKFQSFGDFVFDVFVELLHHVSQIDTNDELVDSFTVPIEPKSNEETRILSLERTTRRIRVVFNSKDGIELRLGVRPHVQKGIKQNKHCTLCGCNSERRRSIFKCTTYNVHLCVRVFKNKRKSCWEKWHASKSLEGIKSEDTDGRKVKPRIEKRAL